MDMIQLSFQVKSLKPFPKGRYQPRMHWIKLGGFRLKGRVCREGQWRRTDLVVL